MRDFLAEVGRHSLVDMILDLDIGLHDEAPPARADGAERSLWKRSVTRRTSCCPMGHPYSAENTYSDGRSRICRTCRSNRRKS